MNLMLAAVAALALGVSSASENPITTKRRAFVSDADDLLMLLPKNAAELLPQDPEDAARKAYLEDLEAVVALKREACEPMREERLEQALSEFERRRQRLLSALYAAKSLEFFEDPQRFEAYMQERMDTLVAIKGLKRMKLTAEQKANVERWETELATMVFGGREGELFDNVGKPRRRDSKLAVLAGADPEQRRAIRWEGVAADEFRPAQESPSSVVPPSPGDATTEYDEAKLVAALRKDGASAAVVQAGLAEAKRRGIDPRLVFAQMKQESGYNPRARSRSGAMGLLQLMPGTAADLRVRRPYGVWDNVRGGVRYIRGRLERWTRSPMDTVNEKLADFAAWADEKYGKQLDRFYAARGRRERRAALAALEPMVKEAPTGIRYAIGSYNAGDAGVRRWYKETRDYVTIVLANFVKYYRKSAEPVAA